MNWTKNRMKPPVKWVGGKTQLLPEIQARLPMQYNTYYEPFFGGGAVCLALEPARAVIGDVNPELMGLYRVIKDHPEELIASLREHRNTPEYYYALRELDRDPVAYGNLTDVERASRILFLNHTCFNGLYRVNRRGEFNAPYGYYKAPHYGDEDNLRRIGAYFSRQDVQMRTGDFAQVLEDAGAGDFVYLDPPYDPVTQTASFTAYSAGGFGREDQIRLKECCDRLDRAGVKFLLSNSNTNCIRELYADYEIDVVNARRNINCKAASRGAVQEVLIRNYTDQQSACEAIRGAAA